jgi:hypothetical protein
MPEISIAFLGLAARANVLGGSIPKYNLLGLSPFVTSHIYPLPLANFQMVLAAHDAANLGQAQIKVLSEEGKTILSATIDIKQIPLSEAAGKGVPLIPNQWTMLLIPFNLQVLVPKPGSYRVVLAEEKELQIGSLTFVHVPAAPFTEERIAAIRADPLASKAVRMEFRCNKVRRSISHVRRLK